MDLLKAISLKVISLLMILFLWQISAAQNKPFVSLPFQLEDDSFADWIIPEEPYGVFYFRKKIDIGSVPEKFIVHSSADARYRLFINGRLVTWGPAVGDTENWFYETTDISPFLQKGENLIAAQVWNLGQLNGHRQQSVKTAFILQGDSPAEHSANTNKSWKVLKDEGYHPLAIDDATAGGGYIAGATDSLVAALHPWDWNKPDFNDSNWQYAIPAGKGNHTGLDTWKGTAWKLQPRQIPAMEQKTEHIQNIISVTGLPLSQHIEKLSELKIPANSQVEILLDNKVLTMGFPHLLLEGGKDSKIKIQYQEALFNSDGTKGNRNQWQGKLMKGYYDIVVADGKKRTFIPLWIRVFRFVKLTVTTKDEPLLIHDFYNQFTAYPLQQKGHFTTENELLNDIWEASWRTLRLCALETFMDCPYYEQVQYIGDSRIQALISMYITGDNRLTQNAIRQFYNSMQPMGLTKSAHPTSGVQIIPPFSLYFIAMVHDYFMLTGDDDFIKQFLPGIKFILEWFNGRIAENGMLGPLPYWNHIDGGTSFRNGSPPGIDDGGSAHMTILLAYALDRAALLLNHFDAPCDAERFAELSQSLKQKTYELCYAEEKQLIAETPAKNQFSQHTNIFAILTDTFAPEEQQAKALKILEDKSLIQSTLYFRFYLFKALKKTGMGDIVIDQMQEWKKFLDNGLTTFPEHGINSRSDRHAWSAHPMYAFLTITCGIEPGSPGFKSVDIRPAPGNLTSFTGNLPHQAGEILLHYNRYNPEKYKVILPPGLHGTFTVDGMTYPLTEGENIFR